MNAPRVCCGLAVLIVAGAAARAGAPGPGGLETGAFRWRTGAALVAAGSTAGSAAGQTWVAIKDPSVVRDGDRWHVFGTVRGQPRTHAIVHLAFKDWADAGLATPRVLPLHAGYFCAPQVFFFRPQGRWYLICQASDDAWDPAYQPAFATAPGVGDPEAWSRLTPLFGRKPAGVEAWLDFWVICDAARAHLFFASLDGRMWRAATRLEDFPRGWTDPVVALQGDVFEASHTYRLRGEERYLTLIEAQNGQGRRYYKAYLAGRLEGPWQPLAADKDRAFASMANVRPTAGRWTDVISHGELLRTGADERLEVDPDRLRFLFQGVSDAARAGKGYGDIPWRLGLLEPDE